MEFTPQQKKAINAPHDHNAIVTAAAGSGKTTLLVDRIIRLLSDRSLGISADTLAIMTFTRNAAASLRTKLIKKLNSRIKELSSDNTPQAAETRSHLSEQAIALRSAAIGTIDSFCISVIKENVHAFGLPMNFSIADKAKVFSMKSLAMKRTLAYFYEKNDGDSFTDDDISPEERRVLFYTFSFEDDEELQSNIASVFETISSFSDREKWLKLAAEGYDSFDKMAERFVPLVVKKLAGTLAKSERIVPVMRDILRDYRMEQADRATWNTEVEVCLDAYAEFCGQLCTEGRNALAQLKAKPSPEMLEAFFAVFSDRVPPAISKKDPKSPAKKRMTAAKKKFTLLEDIAKLSISIPEEKRIFPQQKQAVNTFLKLLKKYMETYRSLMQTNGTLDFAECEYLLLERLRGDETLCGQLSARYSCIIVDEFQDSNDVQAEIFRLLSGGKNNLFYVGDVKQSIYAFRGGNPKIMEQLSSKPGRLSQLCRDNGKTVLLPVGSGERITFAIPLNGKTPAENLRQCGPFTVIPLNKNFRSRKLVVNSVNRLFSGTMTRRFGGVNYSDGAQLELGSDSFYEAIPETHADKYATEIHMLNYGGAEDSSDEADGKAGSEELSAAEKQARFVAERIEQLMKEGFLVTDNGRLRPCKLSDFAILLRGNKLMGAYRDALAERNIPSVLPKDANFLASDEIALIIDLLRVIDDPLRSEEMLRVLMSPIYGFTADECAQIRLGILGLPPEGDVDLSPVAKLMKRRTLYGCLTYCSRENDLQAADSALSDEPEKQFTLEDLDKKSVKRVVSPKVTHFLGQLEAFRTVMSICSIEELISTVYDETEMFNIICTYEGSRQRLSNVRLLQKYAADFESAEGGTLSDFLRFLSRLSEKSLEAANAPEDAANAVRIMTFHASKGLEMPICILAGLNGRANFRDSAKPVLVNSRYGIAMNYVNSKERYRAAPMSCTALKGLMNDNVYSEELRLLYVATTRAMDKLIITGTEKKPLAELIPEANDPGCIFTDAVPLRWIMRSVLRGVSAGAAEAFDELAEDNKELFIGEDLSVFVHSKEVLPECAAAPEETVAPADETLKQQILDKLSLSYKNEAETLMQAKYSVTELAHSSADSTTENVVYLNMPSFVKKGAPTGKEIGDAYHHFMEHCPLEQIKESSCLTDEITAITEKLVESAKITEAECHILTSPNYGCTEKLARFFKSGLGQRMLSDLTKVRRETPFYAEVPADCLGITAPDGTMISLQGRTDLYFFEDDGIVLVDYKSDSPESLSKMLESYCRQLLTYKEILPQVTGVRVKNVYIFGFSEGVTIDVEEYLKEIKTN